MKTHLVCVAGCLALLLSAASARALDIRQGFSGIRWGADISTLGTMQEKSRNEQVGYYLRPDDAYRIENVSLAPVIYGFYQNRFFAAYITIESRQAFDAVRRFLSSEYGAPRAQLRVSQTIFIWDYQDIRIKLKQWKKVTPHKLAYYWSPLSSKLNETRLDEGFEIHIDLVPNR